MMKPLTNEEIKKGMEVCKNATEGVWKKKWI